MLRLRTIRFFEKDGASSTHSSTAALMSRAIFGNAIVTPNDRLFDHECSSTHKI